MINANLTLSLAAATLDQANESLTALVGALDDDHTEWEDADLGEIAILAEVISGLAVAIRDTDRSCNV